MKILANIRKSFFLLISIVLISSCASTANEPRYVDTYLAAIQSSISDQSFDNNTQRFLELYSKLNDPQYLKQNVKLFYADQLYFNDTLTSINNNENLLSYLIETGENLEAIKITVLGSNESGNNLFIRWLMETNLKISGKSIPSRSIGFTHLQFDENNKATLHQDYWDSTEGFYRHLPIVGFLINKIQNRFR